MSNGRYGSPSSSWRWRSWALNAWTNDEDERARFVRDLDAGMVFVNGNVTSYPQLPFGGVKTSGFGRELFMQGIREFCNVKTVWVGK